MQLNTLKPAAGSRTDRKRVGRGIGCGWGKTAGRGHKGQKARSGGYHKVGFEGGQMPLQRRLPKIGFSSRKKSQSAQICLNELNAINSAVVDLETLRKAGLINGKVLRAKVILSGKLNKAVSLKGIAVTKGAKAAIEALGGEVG